jgi:chemotaxis protein methyltransferase CheR
VNPALPSPATSEGISRVDFDYVRDLVKSHTAISLDDSKVYLINARLLPVARRAGYDSVVGLIRHLRSRPFGDLHSKAVEAILTTETSFFRDFYPFDALRREVLPKLIESRRSSNRSLGIWSAGCSGGQEPYSIAMLLRDGFPELATWDLRLHASDVSVSVLEKSKNGLYSQNEVNRGLPAPMLVKFFRQSGSDWRVNDEIRSMVSFFQHNLARDAPMIPPMDIIMMRNVLIYFDVETKRRVLRRIRNHLAPGGYLMLGTAETTLNLDDGFQRQRIGQAVFYRNGVSEVR